jgi:hypothetical protein
MNLSMYVFCESTTLYICTFDFNQNQRRLIKLYYFFLLIKSVVLLWIKREIVVHLYYSFPLPTRHYNSTNIIGHFFFSIFFWSPEKKYCKIHLVVHSQCCTNKKKIYFSLLKVPPLLVFFVTRLIKKQKTKRNENYSLRKKVPTASLRRVSRRPSRGNAWIMGSESKEAPSLTKKSAKLFYYLRCGKK